jgi:hypothetical protein
MSLRLVLARFLTTLAVSSLLFAVFIMLILVWLFHPTYVIPLPPFDLNPPVAAILLMNSSPLP